MNMIPHLQNFMNKLTCTRYPELFENYCSKTLQWEASCYSQRELHNGRFIYIQVITFQLSITFIVMMGWQLQPHDTVDASS